MTRSASGSVSPYYTQEFLTAPKLCGPPRLGSQDVVVPMVMKWIAPKSVLDLGCNDGKWLHAFRKYGAERLVGVDGPYVTAETFHLPYEFFRPGNLAEPIRLHERFDLAVSVEVGEHLAPKGGANLVRSLTRHAPVVLFSAASPFQGGPEHVHERWPMWWARLFDRAGFSALDCIRPRIWSDPRVEWWYAQNILLFVHRDHIRKYPALKNERSLRASQVPSLVHPRRFLFFVEKALGPSALAPEAGLPAGRSGHGIRPHSAAFLKRDGDSFAG
ncbi:MAG: class I SAM-dependent methyltransferase [Nitrospirae bacterium]|nr:class I SAM-dependent methyltransferase [Nitrospirota bacterium]